MKNIEWMLNNASEPECKSAAPLIPEAIPGMAGNREKLLSEYFLCLIEQRTPNSVR